MGTRTLAGQRVRVLVVEDDRPIRSTLDVALRAEGYEVLAREDATDLRGATEKFRPDIAVLDVRLGVGPDGFAAARTLRLMSDLPILFLTAADGIEDRLAGFEAGGDDYLIKPFSVAELVARVRALLKRSGRVTSTVHQFGDLVIDDAARTVVRSGVMINLTRTEFDLLHVLAQHPGQVLTKTQLLANVWGFDAFDGNLVEVHLSALRRKLEAHGPRVVQTVRSVGYVLRA